MAAVRDQEWQDDASEQEARRPRSVADEAMVGKREQGREQLMTVSEVADELRVSNMTVYRLIKAGDLAAIRIGKNYRIRRSDLEEYLDDSTVQIEEQ